MTVSERERHRLYTDLESTLGPDSTSTLMSLLPPVGWADVATRQDLRVLENGIRAELHRELGELRREFHRALEDGLAGARGERGELRGEVGVLRSEMGELRSEMHGEFGELRRAQRAMLFTLLGGMLVLAGLWVAGLTWVATAIA